MIFKIRKYKIHEGGGILQTKKSKDNKAEIIDNVESQNENNLIDKKGTNPELNNMIFDGKSERKNYNEMDENFPNDFFSEEGFDFKNDFGKHLIIYKIIQKRKIFLDVKDAECNDIFFCMCFFTVENIFGLNNEFGMRPYLYISSFLFIIN